MKNMIHDDGSLTHSDIIGQVIGGGFGKVVVRQKSGFELEIGDILVLDDQSNNNDTIFLSVFDLEYSSQMDGKTHEMLSGVTLEEDVTDAVMYEPNIVNYVIASIRLLARVNNTTNAGTRPQVSIPKTLPPFGSKLRLVSKDDFKFLEQGQGGLFVGSIRSGSGVIEDAKVWLPIKDVFTHHVLIPATTGRGKSNLVQTMLWHIMDSKTLVGVLVLDAHDEYYGKTGVGLKDHPRAADRLEYYTTQRGTLPGSRTLIINIKTLEPHHFDGIVDFTDAQLRAIYGYHSKYGVDWIENIMRSSNDDNSDSNNNNNTATTTTPTPSNDNDTKNSRKKDNDSKRTLSIIRRKLKMLLGLEIAHDGKLYSQNGIFDTQTKGENTIDDIVSYIESGMIAIIDASQLDSEAELVVGNMIASKLLNKYKYYKTTGDLYRKPVVSIVIEEAPRVISEDVLASKNNNIYATIAREGRKFQIGLVAITQLSSVIPRAILANMTTKIILGNEMKQERDALIASASQDLSNDDKNIASLDKGEAIITSIFVPFAIPIKIPNFKDVVAQSRNNSLNKGKIRIIG